MTRAQSGSHFFHAPTPEEATQLVFESASRLRDLGLEELAQPALERQEVCALTAQNYAAVNACGGYDATYPRRVRLPWTGERFARADGS